MDDKKKMYLMGNIMRASHFEWRRAALALSPDLDSMALVKRYWEEVGHDTADFYLRKIDPQGDVAGQIAQLFVGSSLAMDEDAEYLGTDAQGAHRACHHDCPWFHWHKNENLLDEDQPGCDHWLKTVIDDINDNLGTRIRFETTETLPAGDQQCLRRFWSE